MASLYAQLPDIRITLVMFADDTVSTILARQPFENVQMQKPMDWSALVTSERIIAVGLLTRRDLDLLGPTFERLWPVEEVPSFAGLLKAIDEADAELQREQRGIRPKAKSSGGKRPERAP
jgi:hypothetical protein